VAHACALEPESEIHGLSIVIHAINDPAGVSERGQGTYTASGPSLSHDRIFASANGGAAISASVATQVFSAPAAEDFDEMSLFTHPCFGGI
jgi:hypothetical protein